MTDWDFLVKRAQGAIEALTHNGDDMADRIEGLEAQLALAVEALELADAALSGANMNMRVVELKVKDALAALRGEN